MARNSQGLDASQDIDRRIAELDQCVACRITRTREKSFPPDESAIRRLDRCSGPSHSPMIQPSRRVQVAGFFALLLVVDWVLYFRHAPHFFQGDTVFLLQHRAASLSAYLQEFVVLNPSGWYRPLANELFESILYPFVGLHP